MSPSATPATQSEGWCHQVPRLPRKTKVDVTKCHACHAKCRGFTGDQAVQARHAVPKVPRVPRKAKVDVDKCHACHVKRRRMSPSATPATQSEGNCTQNEVDVTTCHAYHTKRRWMSPSVMPATQSAAMMCERWCLTKMVDKDGV